MFWAINKSTKQYINSLRLVLDPSYQFITEETWFADPNSIASWDTAKVSNPTEIIVHFRKGNVSITNANGTTYARAPHFFIPNKEERSIITIPESPEHLFAKDWIYNACLNKTVRFKYLNIDKPIPYSKYLELKDIEIDYDKLSIEVTLTDASSRRADVLIPFKKRDAFFGDGIVVEIQFTTQSEEVQKTRTEDRALKGYSTAWIFSDSAKGDSIMNVQEIEVAPFTRTLANLSDDKMREIKVVIQNFSRHLDTVRQELDERIRQIETPLIGRPCAKCDGVMVRKKGTYGTFYGCSSYPQCNQTIRVKI